jgi:hypothetical protein
MVHAEASVSILPGHSGCSVSVAANQERDRKQDIVVAWLWEDGMGLMNRRNLGLARFGGPIRHSQLGHFHGQLELQHVGCFAPLNILVQSFC